MTTSPHGSAQTPGLSSQSGAPDVATIAGRHWPGVHDAAQVGTTQFKLAQVQLARVVKTGGIAAVSGAPGNGKTFTVDHFLHHNPVMADRDHVWLDFTKKPTTKAVTLRLSLAIGLRPNSRDSEYVLVEDLIPALKDRLAQRPLVVCIDEAHHLNADGLQTLRYFHDRCMPLRPGDPPGWALLLVGSTVDRALSGAAELRSRVASWIRFTPLQGKDLLLALRAWHPLLAQMDPELLLELDHDHCRGNWRDWAQFLAAYITTHDKQSATTDAERRKLARIALRLRDTNNL